MAQTGHWVSSLCTNVKIKIFGTCPVASAYILWRVHICKQTISNFFKALQKLEILSFIYFIKSNCGRSFNFNNNRTIFITMHEFVFTYISQIHIIVAFSQQSRKRIKTKIQLIPSRRGNIISRKSYDLEKEERYRKSIKDFYERKETSWNIQNAKQDLRFRI